MTFLIYKEFLVIKKVQNDLKYFIKFQCPTFLIIYYIIAVC